MNDSKERKWKWKSQRGSCDRYKKGYQKKAKIKVRARAETTAKRRKRT
ncbi:MAG: hypothetical protein ACJ71K_17070 [Nitrososphaeraceae archaeon]